MEQVKQVLMPYCKEEGWFLVRNSISKPGVFTISVVHSTGIKHFNVERTPTTFYLKDIQFPTLDELVRYYSYTDVPNKEQITGVKLKFPIKREGTSYLSLYEDDDRRLTGSPDVYIHPEEKRENRSPRPPTHPAPLPPAVKLSGTAPGNIRRNQTVTGTPQRPSTLDMMQRQSGQSADGVVRRSHTFACRAEEAGYSQIDSLELDRPHAHLVMRQMQQQDVDGERCDCGLSLEKSSLPRGWSVHLSQDEESFGEVYFMNSNRETSWTLPLSICLELDAEQQDFIRDRIYEFEQRSKRTARAKMSSVGSQGQPVSSHAPQPDSSGYIKPTPSPVAPRNISPSRPVSVFPPDTNRSKASHDEEVIYMPMNGTAGKQ